jgi:hypothetical protein
MASADIRVQGLNRQLPGFVYGIQLHLASVCIEFLKVALLVEQPYRYNRYSRSLAAFSLSPRRCPHRRNKWAGLR